MTDAVVLREIAFELDLPALLKKLRLDGKAEYAERCSRLARAAAEMARPKAAYRLAPIDSKNADGVVADGVALTSHVLRVNLEEANRVFPFVVTCGAELEGWAKSLPELLERYWADMIMEEAVRAALAAVTTDLARRHAVERYAMMNPGSLPDWPLEEQTAVFTLLGDASKAIGVTLTDSFIMVPLKSASGLLFPTGSTYENCQLCPREACPNRRMPYDPMLYEGRYAAKT